MAPFISTMYIMLNIGGMHSNQQHGSAQSGNDL